VGRLESDEPTENAQLLARLYTQAGSPRCRPLRRSDVHPSGALSPPSEAPGWREHQPLTAADGSAFRLREIAPVIAGRAHELAWTRTRPGAPRDSCEIVSLREVVGSLEAYEPARSLTHAALAACAAERCYKASRIALEVRRLRESPTVLNRALRDAVQARITAGEASLSSIAVACGRVKRDSHGKPSGETSWLARRIGTAPAAPGCPPSPWVHIDVLALIARDGLGLAPREVEVE
ncbi:MAG: hypothetical protein ACYC0H_21270, partial [Solirubrobacteraceae bacterium]